MQFEKRVSKGKNKLSVEQKPSASLLINDSIHHCNENNMAIIEDKQRKTVRMGLDPIIRNNFI
jgi:hypothetical protein